MDFNIIKNYLKATKDIDKIDIFVYRSYHNLINIINNNDIIKHSKFNPHLEKNWWDIYASYAYDLIIDDIINLIINDSINLIESICYDIKPINPPITLKPINPPMTLKPSINIKPSMTIKPYMTSKTIKFIYNDNYNPNEYNNSFKPYEPYKPYKPIKIKRSFKPIKLINPINPINPSNPIKPSNHIKPSKPIKPSNPIKPSKPLKPLKPLKPSDPYKPLKPSKPSKPFKPFKSFKPFNPFKPIESFNPIEPIPNIVHFIFGLSNNDDDLIFDDYKYMAVYSVYKNQNPEFINIYILNTPTSEYWDKTLSIPNVNIINLNTFNAFNELNDYKHLHFSHKSDYLRLKILQIYGGIYLDIDTITLKPYKIKEHSLIIGSVSKNKLSNSIILSTKNNNFINEWINKYDFNNKIWNYNSIELPYLIYTKIIKKGIFIDKSISSTTWINVNDLLFNSGSFKLLNEQTAIHLWESSSLYNLRYMKNKEHLYWKLYSSMTL